MEINSYYGGGAFYRACVVPTVEVGSAEAIRRVNELRNEGIND